MFVKEIMTDDVYSAQSNSSIYEVSRIMNEKNVGVVPIVSGERVVGIITDRDIVTRCVALGFDPKAEQAQRIMSLGCESISPNDDIMGAIRIMSNHQIRRLPVIDNGKLCGVISLGDIAKFRATPEISHALCEISS